MWWITLGCVLVAIYPAMCVLSLGLCKARKGNSGERHE